MGKQAFALIVQNKWHEICAVHVFHSLKDAKDEMWDEVAEWQQTAEQHGFHPYIDEDDGVQVVCEGDCYYWKIVEDIDYEVNNP